MCLSHKKSTARKAERERERDQCVMCGHLRASVANKVTLEEANGHIVQAGKKRRVSVTLGKRHIRHCEREAKPMTQMESETEDEERK